MQFWKQVTNDMGEVKIPIEPGLYIITTRLKISGVNTTLEPIKYNAMFTTGLTGYSVFIETGYIEPEAYGEAEKFDFARLVLIQDLEFILLAGSPIVEPSCGAEIYVCIEKVYG